MHLFLKYFPKSELFALDKNFKFKFKSKRVKFINCNINNNENLNLLKKKFKNKKFNIIIDDGSHFLRDILVSDNLMKLKKLEKKKIYTLSLF